MPRYQPITTFPEGIKAAFSAAEDGSVAAGGGNQPTTLHRRNAESFLVRLGFYISNRTKILVSYQDGRVYNRVRGVSRDNAGQSIETDAVYTVEPGLTLTLPVADCLATIVYDPVSRMVGMLHLGRHSSVDGLIEAFAKKVQAETGSLPPDWHVWMSPGLGQAHNRLQYFSPPSPKEWQQFSRTDKGGEICIDMAGHNRQRFIALGVMPAQITVSDIDTYSSPDYFSHRAATEPGGDPRRQGRMMAAAALL